MRWFRREQAASAQGLSRPLGTFGEAGKEGEQPGVGAEIQSFVVDLQAASAYRRTQAERDDQLLSWRRADRAFFAAGACHILAWTCRELFPAQPIGIAAVRATDEEQVFHTFATWKDWAFDHCGWHMADDSVRENEDFVGYPIVRLLASADGVRRPREEFTDPERGVVCVDVAGTYDASAQVTSETWYLSTDSEPDFVVVPLEIRSIFSQELPPLLSLGGLRLVERYGDFSSRPFASDSRSKSASARQTPSATARPDDLAVSVRGSWRA